MSEPMSTPPDPRPAVPPPEAAPDQPPEAPAESEAAEGADGANGPRRRRRGSRGGRRRKRPAGSSEARQRAGEAAQAGGDASTADDAGPAEVEAVADDRRPDDMPGRPGEGRPPPEVAAQVTIQKPKIGDSRPAPAAAPSEPADEPATRRRRRRGGRGRGAKRAETVAEEPLELDAETLERRRGRERKGRPVGRYLMCVHVRPGATQIAVLEGRSLIEHYVPRPADA